MEDLFVTNVLNVLQNGLKPVDIYSICDFAVKMAKDEDGHYNRVLFEIAALDAYALVVFPEIQPSVEGKDIFEVCQWLQENNYMGKIAKKDFAAVMTCAENELWNVENYECSTGVVLRSFMDVMNTAFDNLSNKADLNIANEDVQSVLNIAEKYGMK